MPANIPSPPSTYTDIDPLLTKNPKNGDVMTVKDSKAIKVSLQNLLSTAFGERLFQPQLGASLRPLLFDPIDSISAFEMRDRILQTIRKHEPRVSNIIVDIVAYPDNNQYEVTVEYTIQSLGATDRLTTLLERIR